MSELKDFLDRDHERLDALLVDCLNAARAQGGRLASPVALGRYADFRGGLLRHIGIEERVLFPFLRAKVGVTPLEQQLHRDHAAIAALLVPPPTEVELGEIASLLHVHNDLEECAGGLYETIEELAGDQLSSLFERVENFPVIPPAPFSDTPILRRTIAHLLREARRQPSEAAPLGAAVFGAPSFLPPM